MQNQVHHPQKCEDKTSSTGPCECSGRINRLERVSHGKFTYKLLLFKYCLQLIWQATQILKGCLWIVVRCRLFINILQRYCINWKLMASQNFITNLTKIASSQRALGIRTGKAPKLNRQVMLCCHYICFHFFLCYTSELHCVQKQSYWNHTVRPPSHGNSVVILVLW